MPLHPGGYPGGGGVTTASAVFDLLEAPADYLASQERLESLLYSDTGLGKVVSRGGDFGDGSDGPFLLSASSTLTDDLHASSVTVQNSGILDTANFRVFGVELVEVESGGIVRCNGGAGGAGGAGAGGAAGASTGQGSINGTSTPGGAGSAAGAGSNGTNASNSMGARGGNGGAGSGGAGGTSGTAPAPAASAGDPFKTGIMAQLAGSPSRSGYLVMSGGSSGGGGGGSAGGGGGGGGAGGGIVCLNGRHIYIRAGGTVEANGGAGGDAHQAAGDGGGGGGGGPGRIILRYGGSNLIEAGTVRTLAGAGGLGRGTGSPGVAATSGTFVSRVGV